MGPEGIADLVTAQSDPGDWLWRTVRKGVAPAFAPQALRSGANLLWQSQSCGQKCTSTVTGAIEMSTACLVASGSYMLNTCAVKLE